MDNKLRWQLISILFICLVGTIFHFLYELTNFSSIVLTFAPVNESSWEHLKMSFWPLVIFAPIEYKLLKVEVNNYILGKLISVIISMSLTLAIFYAYMAITEINIAAINIIGYYIAIMLGELVGYKILALNRLTKTISIISLIILILISIFFIIFTFYPPHVFLFQDPISGNYGIHEYIYLS